MRVASLTVALALLALAFLCSACIRLPPHVARALEAGGALPAHVGAVSSNRSLGVALAWLKIESPTLIPAGTLVSEENRVALLSREFTPAQVNAYFEIKRELHRRFGPDQKLGNVFRWSWGGLTLREPVREFMREGMELARSAPQSFDGDAVRELAAVKFGSLEMDTRAVRADRD